MHHQLTPGGKHVKQCGATLQRLKRPPYSRKPHALLHGMIIACLLLVGTLTGCASSPTGLPSVGHNDHVMPSTKPGIAAALTSCLRRHGFKPPAGFNPYAPSFRTLDIPTRAELACLNLIYEVLPPLTDRQKEEVTDFVVCMRNHGIPTSDPIFKGPKWQFSYGASVDSGSPRFLRAQAACAGNLPKPGH